MQKVENGMFVSVAYIGTLENGEVFDSNVGKEELKIVVGQHQVIKQKRIIISERERDLGMMDIFF